MDNAGDGPIFSSSKHVLTLVSQLKDFIRPLTES